MQELHDLPIMNMMDFSIVELCNHICLPKVSIEWVAEFRSIVMTQIDSIKHNKVIPEFEINRVDQLQ